MLNPNFCATVFTVTLQLTETLTHFLLNPDAFANRVDPDPLASVLDLHYLSLKMWICINNLDQVIWFGWKLEVGIATSFIQRDKG